MARWVRGLAVFSQDMGSIPSTHVLTGNPLEFSSRGSNGLFSPPKILGMRMVNRQTCRLNTQIQKIKMNKF